MRRNLASSLPGRHAPPMAGYDLLPAELRHWLAHAALPWSSRSALRLWRRALDETGCTRAALRRLDEVQSRMLARDARSVWGTDYPAGIFQMPGQLCSTTASIDT